MSIDRLQQTVTALSRMVDRDGMSEPQILAQASALMADLVSVDDWLPDELAVPHPEYYRQYLLYGDPLDRFSLVSFVWGPGQKTPVHDHTVWGVIAMLRGSEVDQPYEVTEQGAQPAGKARILKPGQVACVSPEIGDVHRVSNALDDQVSISIHLYGGNIGRIRRSVFDIESGASKPFVSGYSNAFTPNLWVSPA